MIIRMTCKHCKRDFATSAAESVIICNMAAEILAAICENCGYGTLRDLSDIGDFGEMLATIVSIEGDRINLEPSYVAGRFSDNAWEFALPNEDEFVADLTDVEAAIERELLK
jgi:hypothetical protein